MEWIVIIGVVIVVIALAGLFMRAEPRSRPARLDRTTEAAAVVVVTAVAALSDRG